MEEVPGSPGIDDMVKDPAVLDRLADLLDGLSLICTFKADALRQRRAGNEDRARAFDAKVDTIYRTLPKWARW